MPTVDHTDSPTSNRDIEPQNGRPLSCPRDCPLLSKLPSFGTPPWIRAAKLGKRTLPVRELLTNSVFYPACGLDGDPVQYLGGNFHSFIYVDYGVGRDRVVSELPRFRGYELAAYRDVGRHEFTVEGWTPRLPSPEDGDPEAFADMRKPPFAVWSIHQRRKFFYGPHHGPERFSLLYLGGEGVQAFQELYYAHKTSPRVVAVIQTGHAFGLNWTNFEQEEGFFARTVLGNPHGAHEYLLYGGSFDEAYYTKACWPTYSEHVATLHSRLHLWRGAHTITASSSDNSSA